MLKIKKSSIDNIGVITLVGKLSGIDCTGTIQEKVKEINSKEKIKNFIVDMSKVKWIDSTGLGELIATLSSLQKQGGNMVLVNIPSPVQSLLKMTNLDQIFDIFNNMDEAVASFNSKKKK